MTEHRVKAIRRMELYKYARPRTFDQMVGNQETVDVLTEYIDTNTLPHAILIQGPSGCGKTTLARILAREVGCSDQDLYEINCANHRGIDTVRSIESTMRLAAWGGGSRAWILDEAHMLTGPAQQASLKMLEDSPRHVYFFICTTDPQKLLDTVRNRATHIPVNHLDEDEVLKLLWSVCKRIGLTIPKSVASDLATRSGGSARKALVLLDKIKMLPESKMIDALEERSDEDKEAIDLCRVLIKTGTNWAAVAPVLKKLKGEPEGIRHACLGYAKAVLLGGRPNPRAFSILCAFESSFVDSKGPGLVRACYDVIHNG